MQTWPTSLLSLGRMFPNDAACTRYMVKVRWPEGFSCPYCSGDKAYWIKSRAAVQCSKCRKQITLTSGTVMHKSKTSLCKWFVGAYLMTTHTPGISAVQFKRQAGISRYETAFQILHKLRAVAIRPGRERLVGVVEVDETFVGGRKAGKRGRGATGKTLVVAAVEVRGGRANRVRLQRISNAEHNILAAFLKGHVEPGSKVRTDSWTGYLGIKKYGYRHQQVLVRSAKRASKVLPHVHRIFSNLKSWLIGTHHGVSSKHLQAYLNEYAFRFNRRANPWRAFNTLLGIGAWRVPPTYRRLYSGAWKHPNGQ